VQVDVDVDHEAIRRRLPRPGFLLGPGGREREPHLVLIPNVCMSPITGTIAQPSVSGALVQRYSDLVFVPKDAGLSIISLPSELLSTTGVERVVEATMQWVVKVKTKYWGGLRFELGSNVEATGLVKHIVQVANISQETPISAARRLQLFLLWQQQLDRRRRSSLTTWVDGKSRAGGKEMETGPWTLRNMVAEFIAPCPHPPHLPPKPAASSWGWFGL